MACSISKKESQSDEVSGDEQPNGEVVVTPFIVSICGKVSYKA